MVDGDRTDYPVFPQHRHNDNRAGAAEFGQLNTVWGAYEVSGSGAHVFYLNRLLGSDRGGHQALWVRTEDLVGSCCRKRRRRIIEGSLAQGVAFDQIHRSELRAADPRSVLQYLLEHRGKITRRRTDDLQDLGGRSLLLEGFLEIACLGLHL